MLDQVLNGLNEQQLKDLMSALGNESPQQSPLKPVVQQKQQQPSIPVTSDGQSFVNKMLKLFNQPLLSPVVDDVTDTKKPSANFSDISSDNISEAPYIKPQVNNNQNPFDTKEMNLPSVFEVLGGALSTGLGVGTLFGKKYVLPAAIAGGLLTGGGYKHLQQYWDKFRAGNEQELFKNK
jgi:hypothetical protein